MRRNKIIEHYKNFFGLEDLVLGEDDQLMIDWAESLINDHIVHDAVNRFDSKYVPPFRVGRKQGKAVLDANGKEVTFFKTSEEQARLYCDYLNNRYAARST